MLFALLFVSAHYDFLTKDFVAGGLDRTDANGEVVVEFSYRDNGRGPTFHERYAVGKDNLTSLHTISGTTTFGSTVDERFDRKAGASQWKTRIDAGESKDAAFYWPLTSTPEHMAVLARALLRSPKQSLPLLPSGQASITKVRTEVVDANGKRMKISLYAVTGLDLSPAYVWLDDQKRDFFAALSPGPYGLILHEYAAHAKRLGEMIKAADDKLLRALHQKTRHTLDAPLAIKNVRVFDTKTAALSDPRTVYLFRGRIGAVVPASEPIGKDAHVIDAAGKTLLPGLIDVHGHEWPWGAPLQIAGGVTIVRDIGNDNDEFLSLMKQVEHDEVTGPRYLGRAGFLEGLSEHAARFSGLAKSLDEAKQWVDWYAQHGYRQLKIYNSFKPEWVEPTVAYAHERGLRVSGHIPAFTNSAAMVRAGYDELQHINQVFLNFLAGPKDDTRTLLRFTLVAEKGQSLQLDGPEVSAYLDLLKKRGVAVDPTVAVFEAMFCQDMGEPSPTFSMIASHLPVSWQRGLRQSEMDATPEQRKTYRASYRRMLEMVAKMDKVGVTIMPGTDGLPGFLLHRELELYVEAGIKPARVLQLATLGTAQELGFDGFGAIAPGAPADVILVDGDPTKNISAVRKIALVSKGADLYFPSEIYQELGIAPFTEAAKVVAPAAP
jgi:hypothetical protein